MYCEFSTSSLHIKIRHCFIHLLVVCADQKSLPKLIINCITDLNNFLHLTILLIITEFFFTGCSIFGRISINYHLSRHCISCFDYKCKYNAEYGLTFLFVLQISDSLQSSANNSLSNYLSDQTIQDSWNSAQESVSGHLFALI